MPNWCTNHATFSHDDPKTVTALENVLREFKNSGDDGSKIGPFQFLCPMPENPIVQKPDIVSVTDAGETIRTPSQMPDWWHWRVSNWGTKWEPACLEFERTGANTIDLSFDTAWNPPIQLFDAALKHGWEITAYYFEPNMGFEGEYENGIDNCRDIEAEEIEE